MHNLLLLAGQNSGSSEELAQWSDSAIPAAPTTYSIVDSGGDSIIANLGGTIGTVRVPIIIGGWRSDTGAALATIVQIHPQTGKVLRLTDTQRIGATPMVWNPRWFSFEEVGSEHLGNPSWGTSDVMGTIIVSYVDSSNSIVSGGSKPSTTHYGVVINYSPPGRPSAPSFSFTVAGSVNPGSIIGFNRSTNAARGALTGFPNHGLFARGVVGPDGETAYIIGGSFGANADVAHGMVTSFNMKNASTAAAGAFPNIPLAPMPFPASRGVAYLDNDKDTITYIGGHGAAGNTPNGGRITDAISKKIQRYSISKNEWTVDELEFPMNVVGACYIELPTKRIICQGFGNIAGKFYEAPRVA